VFDSLIYFFEPAHIFIFDAFKEHMAGPIKRLIGQMAIYGLSSIIGRFLNYLLVPLYLGIFVASEYGAVTELFAYAGFLMVLLTYGMETAYFRYSEKHENPEKVFSTAISPILLSSSFFIAVVILFAEPIASALKYSNNTEYIIYFALIIGLDSISAIPFAKLRRENKAVKFAIFKFINIGLNIGSNIFFLILCPKLILNNPDSIISVVYSDDIGIGYIFISNLIASVVTILLFIPEFFKVKYSFSKALLKQLFIYGFPLLFAGLAGMINEVIDRILLKYLITVPEGVADGHKYVMAQIGIYGANYKLSVLVVLFIQAFRYAAEPFFFSEEKKENAKEIYALVMKYFVIFGLFIFLGIMLYMDIVKYFLRNEEYWQGLHIVPILLLANLMLGVVYNLSVWFKLTNKTKYGAYIAGIGASITILFNLLLVPHIGYLASAWGHFACYFTMMIISFFLGRKYYRIKYPLKDIFTYTFLALLLYFISKYISLEGWLMYIVNTFMILTYLAYVVINEKLYKRFVK
jgi:O-antigen/teichoic acid export membrane protein